MYVRFWSIEKNKRRGFHQKRCIRHAEIIIYGIKSDVLTMLNTVKYQCCTFWYDPVKYSKSP